MLLDPAKFDRIVQHARATNPFYRDWIRDPAHVPILTRRTLLENNDRILNGNLPMTVTSGSTGIPVRIFMGPKRVQMNGDDQDRFIGWLGGSMPVVQIIFPRAGSPPADLMNINAPVDEQIEFIFRRRREAGTVAITTYPTNAVMLSDRIIELGIDMSFIRRFGVFSEPFEKWQRDRISRTFPNAQVWSTYSAAEVGMISLQCPHEPEFQHIMTHKLGVEVLDENDRPVGIGRPGRLILTDYYNPACPFIRYEIGDLVELAHCPCGKIDLPAFSKIHGKVRGALVRRDGQRIMFVGLSHLLAEIPGMVQFQVIQHAVEAFTVRLVSRVSLDELVRQAFNEHFGYVPQISFEYLESIPREPSGKFYSSISHI